MSIKGAYGSFLTIFVKLFGIGNAKKFDTRLRFNRSLNLNDPQSLADKVSYIELYEQSDKASSCTDKYEVRKYLKEKGLEHLLVPLVGGPWNSTEEVDFGLLPMSFVLKATHGCKMNYIVPNKSHLNINDCVAKMNRWLATTYGTYSIEPHYTNIPHRLFAEEYLGDISDLIDYKIHCMNGVPVFVLTTSNRKANGDKAMQVTLDLFDMEWNPVFEIVGANSEVAGNGAIPKPHHFEEMIEISKILSKDFKFVRVDLYELNDKIYFGELTFSPACCVFPYISEKYLNEMGKKLRV